MHRRADAMHVRGGRGYTIVELAIVLSIVGILAAVGGSQYASYLDRARTARAIAELQAIAKQLEPLPDEDWTYPESLADAGITMRDPWGNPYRYLLISGNLPRGLSDARSALPPVAAGSGGPASATGAPSTTSASGAPVTGTAPADGSGGASASGAAGTGAADPGATGSIAGGGAGGSHGSPAGSGGAGAAAAGAGRAGGGGGSIMGEVRKDRFQVPINSDFDLYSSGPDGQSRGPLSAPVSRDDVIRANDGAYYGVAEDF